MPVPSLISDLDTNAANNSPPGTESAKGNIDNYLRAAFAFIKQTSNLTAGATATLASASTVAIGAAAVNNITISGSATITAFDTVAEGSLRFVTFSGAATLTYNATSLILPGAANIVTAAGDTAIFKSLGGGNWQCLSFQRAASAVGATPSLLAVNGYQKLPSGLMIQWGAFVYTTAGVGQIVSLPAAFPNTFFTIVGSRGNNTAAPTTYGIDILPSGGSLNSFGVSCTEANVVLRWVAFGN